jgi:predicted metal-binding membrane protein
MAELSALEYWLRRDRIIVAVGLAAVVALAWTYLVAGAGMGGGTTDMGMEAMPDMDMSMSSWTVSYIALLFVMWWVMMIAMMVPSAAPTVLLFATIKRRQDGSAHPQLDAWAFLGGYLLMWAGFSALAVLAQWGLDRGGLLSAAMVSTSAGLAGIILIAAGIYQFTPVKSACLRYCRSPLLFLSQHWQPRAWGALRMGLRHGGYCLGCCWFLMALLFVSGVMNLVGIAAIALYVAGEKLLPVGRWFSRASGAALIGSGAFVLARALVV